MSTPISVHKEKSREPSGSSKKSYSSSSPTHPYTHSTRLPQTGTVVLDLMTLRSKETSAFKPASMDDPDMQQNSIEECIKETFQRIDAQNSSNSFEDDDARMSIIENPLSEGVSRLTEQPMDEPVSEVSLLNNRVDQLAKYVFQVYQAGCAKFVSVSDNLNR